MNWFLMVLRRYAEFSGRSRRMEYWMFTLINCIVGIVLGIVGTIMGLTFGGLMKFSILSCIYSLLVLIPGIAVTARRLHDTGRSGWWMLIAFFPILGAIALIVFLALPGTAGPNAYGPDPKAAPSTI